MAKKKKETLIKEDFEKLQMIFKNIDKDKYDVVSPLIERACFMQKTLQDLEEDINKQGAIICCINGNNIETIKENPSSKVYNTMIGKYSTVISQLCNLFPKEQKIDDDDDLLDFINKN